MIKGKIAIVTLLTRQHGKGSGGQMEEVTLHENLDISAKVSGKKTACLGAVVGPCELW